jgi:hypothetical protein
MTIEITNNCFTTQMLKFANAATIAQKKSVEITETDKGILSIMETSDSLKSQIDELEATMSK